MLAEAGIKHVLPVCARRPVPFARTAISVIPHGGAKVVILEVAGDPSRGKIV